MDDEDKEDLDRLVDFFYLLHKVDQRRRVKKKNDFRFSDYPSKQENRKVKRGGKP